MAFGQIAALAGSAALGGLSASNDKKNRRAAQAHGQFLLDDILAVQGEFAGLEQGALLDMIGTLDTGYDQARLYASDQAHAGRQAVLDREQADLGRVGSSAVGAGLYGSSAQSEAQRGVRSSADRALLGIESELAGIMADIESQRARSVAGGQAALADFYNGRADDYERVQMNRYQLFTGAVPQADATFDLSGVYDIIKDAF